MTNPMINPQSNYSGVTIQIANPAVYATNEPHNYGAHNQQVGAIPNVTNPYQNNVITNPYYNGEGCNILPPQINSTEQPYIGNGEFNEPKKAELLPQPIAYPPQYYLNNYNYQNNVPRDNVNLYREEVLPQSDNLKTKLDNDFPDGKDISTTKNELVDEEIQDMTKSKAVIDDLDARALEETEVKKNTKQKKIVALTNEYIKSLENYLNNPNDEIRLMASKEILTRLDEDKDRFDDAALNALLNKMLQDPSKLIRVAALSAFSSQLASGNDYTVELLHNIQQNPNADKEDVLQAADILLKMSSGTEMKNIPDPSVKDDKEQ